MFLLLVSAEDWSRIRQIVPDNHAIPLSEAAKTALLPFTAPMPHRVKAQSLFTPRESEVHDLLQEGMSNKEIANSLQIAVVTVKLHVRNILRKTGCVSRARLLAQRA